MDTHKSLESCLLCGKILIESDRKRRKSILKIQRLLCDVWKLSEFVWKTVYNVCENMDDKTNIAMCMACTHWTTRSRRRRRACTIPLDQLLLFTIAPFHAPRPDGRLLRRLILSMKETKRSVNGIEYSNTYTNFLEPEMLKCFQSIPNEKLESMDTTKICKIIVANWWRQNSFNVFTTHKNLAKYIRSTCKQEIIQLGQEIMEQTHASARPREHMDN